MLTKIAATDLAILGNEALAKHWQIVAVDEILEGLLPVLDSLSGEQPIVATHFIGRGNKMHNVKSKVSLWLLAVGLMSDFAPSRADAAFESVWNASSGLLPNEYASLGRYSTVPLRKIQYWVASSSLSAHPKIASRCSTSKPVRR